MTLEELLQPRYKIIADYPLAEFKTGDLLQRSTHNNPPVFYIGLTDESGIHVWFGEESLSEYPHIFKKLHWWQERKMEDLPKYIKYKSQTSGKYVVLHCVKYEIKGWYGNRNATVFTTSDGTEDMLWYYHLPATEEEYNSQIK